MSKAAVARRILAGPQPPSNPPPARLLQVPGFDPDAHGCPRDWHDTLYWGKKSRHLFKVVEGARVDVMKMWVFLEKRLGPDRQPITNKLGLPVDMGGGLYRLRCLLHTDIHMPQESLAGGAAEWARAWHGCPLEALYSILYHGRLMESSDESQGHRFFSGSPGVYVHKEAIAHKAENYTRFVPIFQDGTLWAAKW